MKRLREYLLQVFCNNLRCSRWFGAQNSLWPLPFATSCCGIEFMATMGTHYDLGRFGAERLSFSPRQADLLMVMGTIAKKDSARGSTKFMSK